MQGATLNDMVIENLMLERQQVAAYTALIRKLGDDDLVTRQLLLQILADTEQHASELADYLKRTADTQRKTAEASPAATSGLSKVIGE